MRGRSSISSCIFSGTADTALAEPSGAGGGASAHYPQSADYVGNVSVRHTVSSVIQSVFLGLSEFFYEEFGQLLAELGGRIGYAEIARLCKF